MNFKISRKEKRQNAAYVIGLLLFIALYQHAFAQAISAGTYSGTYEGGDYGTLTVTIDAHAIATCDFFSVPMQKHFVIPGSAAGYLICQNSVTDDYYWTAVSIVTAPSPSALTGGWVFVHDYQQTQGTFSATLSGANGSLANPSSITGLWYDPKYSGSGFNITMSNAGLLVTYYGWDNNHNRLWLSGDIGPTQIVRGTAFTINMNQTAGGSFLAPAPSSTNTKWGTLTLSFSSCTAATGVLSGSDGMVNLNLQQLVGVANLPGC